MFERIETDAAEFPGGIVSEAARDEAMGCLMKGDRNDQREDPDREVVKGDFEWQIPVLRCATIITDRRPVNCRTLILRSAPCWARVSKDGRKRARPSFETPRNRAAPQDEVAFVASPAGLRPYR